MRIESHLIEMKENKMNETTQITKTNFYDVWNLLGENTEALVFLGCGGPLTEWTKGISEQLDGIVPTVLEWYKIKTTGGRIDLVMLLPKKDVDIGKLAIWRIKFGDCSWWSDYVTNYCNQHAIEAKE